MNKNDDIITEKKHILYHGEIIKKNKQHCNDYIVITQEQPLHEDDVIFNKTGTASLLCPHEKNRHSSFTTII